ncbi:MAG TPA: DEAD/DEAH box helicase family protein [Ignavibacteriaceae bacterium]|nr:DEAD/DEAH box helicase family protein [Ignavibacteriaceae bacterium]
MTPVKNNSTDDKRNLSIPSTRKQNEFNQALSNIYPDEGICGNYKIIKVGSKLLYQNIYEQLFYDADSKTICSKPPISTSINLDKILIQKLVDYPLSEVINDFFSMSYDYERVIDGKINLELIDTIIKKIKENILLISPPNSGKTFNVIKYLLEKKIKFVLIVPLNSQVWQLKEDHLLKDVDKDTAELLVKDFINQGESIVTVYDQIPKIFKCISYPPDYYLIIDEYHKMVTDSNYRGNAIRSIREVMHRFGRTIALSASPYGCIDYRNPGERFKIVNLISDAPGVCINEYKIVTGCQENRFNILIKELLIKYQSNSLQIIFRNHINDLEITKKFITEKMHIMEDDVLIFSSETKDDEIQLQIIETGKIPSNIKYLLCTSAISTGLNIYSKADKIYIGSEPSIVEVYQFINRFREGVDTVFDLIEGDPDPQEKHFYKFREYQSRSLDSWEFLAEYLMGLKLYRELEPDILFKRRYNVEYKEKEIIEKNGSLEPFEEYIIFRGLKDYFKMSIKNQQVRKLFLKKYLGKNKIIIESIDGIIDLKPILTKRIEHDFRQNFPKYIDLINHYPSKVQNHLYNKNLINFREYENNRFIRNFFAHNDRSEKAIGLDDVGPDNLSSFFEPFKWYISLGIEKDLAIKLISIEKCEELYYSLKFIYYLSLKDELKLTNEYKRIGSKLNLNERKFAQQLNEFLNKQNSVTSKNLKSKFNKKSKSVLHNYFKSGYVERLKKVYRNTRVYNNAKKDGHRSGYKFKDILKLNEVVSQFGVNLLAEELKELTEIIKADV